MLFLTSKTQLILKTELMKKMIASVVMLLSTVVLMAQDQTINGSLTVKSSLKLRTTGGTGTASLDLSGTTTYIHVAGQGLIAREDNQQDLGIYGWKFRNLWLGSNAYIEGKVGIGTTIPKEKLHLEGNLLLDTYSIGNDNGIFFREGFSDTNKYNLSILNYDHSNSGITPDGLSINAYDGISFSTGSSSRNERMRIHTNGRVGIGSTNPTAELEVKSIANNNSEIHINASTDGEQSIIRFQDAGVNTWGFLSNYPHVGKFSLYNYQNSKNAIVVDQAGNVGIGIPYPDAKLHIFNGNNSYGAILANSSETPFSLYTKSLDRVPNTETFRIGLKHNTEENNGFISFYRGGGTSGGFLGFSTNGTERIRINSNGDVGIGTTNPKNKIHAVKNPTTGLHNLSHSGVLGVFENNGGSRILLGTDSNSGSVINFGDTEAWNSGEIYYDHSLDQMRLRVNNAVRMTIFNNGNVGIGNGVIDTKGYELAVNGRIITEEVKVALYGNWSDFVFKSDYDLPTLQEVETHIKEKGHLKDIPNATEVANEGFFLGEMDAKLLQKIEELTLYTIQQQKEIESLKSENEDMKVLNKKLLELQLRLEKLESGK